MAIFSEPLDAETTALALMSWLILKHFIFDFVLQSASIAINKGRYGHSAGLLHAGGHAVGTAPGLWFFGVGGTWILTLCVAEFILHYHIDWAKAQISDLRGWTPDTSAFWIAIGFDQFLHYATYVALVVAAF